MVSSSPTPTISYTPLQCPHFRPQEDNIYWTMIISRENTLRVKPAEPNKHSYIYHERNIVGSQRIQIIISIIKKHYFICRSISSKQQGSESTSVLLEYLITYFYKVEFSILLENRKCTKNTANISN